MILRFMQAVNVMGTVNLVLRSGTVENISSTNVIFLALSGGWKGPFDFTSPTLACVASVSNRVIARKLELEQQKKKGGRVRGRGEEETLARKPHDSGKRLLIFHGSVHL